MVFWRKKKNIAEQEREEREDKILHPQGEPAIEPSTDYEPEMDESLVHDLQETEDDILEELEAEPVPYQEEEEARSEREELDKDHDNEGGWLSRLTSGLSKSTNKITQGLTDVLTKKKLDQDMLDELEEVLITADLGPKTAAKIIEDFSKDRFGKDISEEEVKLALADSMARILKPVAQPLKIEKPQEGPFVILVCGVNGAGKTTTIGKMAHDFSLKQKYSVMLAAGDTFRAAAIEQLKIWADRVHCPVLTKDIGADSAAVAFEAYEKAKAENRDILMIDTAGRLQNKKNLMEELQKIIRVLKKQDENLPHAVLLVLDATTGQNAFSQVQAFQEMVNVTGLSVTKLDGTAKGGVLVGLADQFGLPVHAIGVGEKMEDLAPFSARDFANSLVGLTLD
ncbi:MAG: signal recognition particle-docking protein FtsY [Alphaproteobacteria bacterium]